MDQARSEHGASVVNVEEVEQLCVETQKRKIGILGIDVLIQPGSFNF